jgi:preprotein translocase subunit SecB
MTDTSAGNGDTGSANGGDAQAPQININAQYVKDLSFENPGAPQSLTGSGAPQIEVNIDVGAQAVGENQYEVHLRITATADRDDTRVFVAEVVYAGLFTIANATEDTLRPLMLIECPRFLFPFARRIIADATRDGGFPPLLLEPIDFAQLYQTAQAQEQAQQQSSAET